MKHDGCVSATEWKREREWLRWMARRWEGGSYARPKAATCQRRGGRARSGCRLNQRRISLHWRLEAWPGEPFIYGGRYTLFCRELSVQVTFLCANSVRTLRSDLAREDEADPSCDRAQLRFSPYSELLRLTASLVSAIFGPLLSLDTHALRVDISPPRNMATLHGRLRGTSLRTSKVPKLVSMQRQLPTAE
jgi:hypothetical protein